MFFSVTKEPPTNFNVVHHVGNFYIGTDSGWQSVTAGNKTFVFKGYADTAPLGELLGEIDTSSSPKFVGNFCVLVYSGETQSLSIKTDRYRGFPIYIEPGHEITNLKKLSNTAWADSQININSDFTVSEGKFDVIGNIDTAELTFAQALDQVDTILSARTEQFLRHNTLPVRVFLSGGVDSMLVYSYIQKYTDQYELVKCQHIDYDRFWLLNYNELRRNWGYAQIHHWTDPCVLTSGAPGDEFMLRSPTTANLYLLVHNTSIPELLELPGAKSLLHYSYFTEPKHTKLFDQQQQLEVQSSEDLHWRLSNIVVNDWQHWHIGNTMTWTPLRDIEIFKTILRMPYADCVDQILDSTFSRALIARNNPQLNELISDQKNTGSTMANLADFYFPVQNGM